MNWIESGGGPLVLVPKLHAKKWHGVVSLGPDGRSDYDRACEVSDEIARISIDGVDVIVFGDEPFRTTWSADERGGMFVRWVYADSENVVLEFLQKRCSLGPVSEVKTEFAARGDCWLFDTAEPGDDIRGGRLDVPLRPGIYTVSSELVDPTPSSRLLVHQFIWTR